MRLVTNIQQRMVEELPGYRTVYGDDGVSIGVAVDADVEGFYWYFGEGKLDATDATDDELNKLTEVYGMPKMVPCRQEAPPLEEYEYPAKTIERQSREESLKISYAEPTDTKEVVAKVK